MARNRSSAKKAGTAFETLIANALRDALGDNTIGRAPRWGAVDKGDIVNVRLGNSPIVIQAKNVARLSLPEWVSEAKVQAVNTPGAIAGLVVHKRHGTQDPMKQWVTCTVAELVALLTKVPVHQQEAKGNADDSEQRAAAGDDAGTD